MHGDGEECTGGDANVIHHHAGLTGDFATFVDVVRVHEERRSRRNQAVEIGHDAVFIDERPRKTIGIDRLTYDLSAIVDAERVAHNIGTDRLEVLRLATLRCPKESMEVRNAARVTRQVHKSCDDSVVIDGCRCIPRHAAEIAKVGNRSVFPHYGVSRAEASDSAIADPGDADDRSFIVDGCRRRACVNTDWRQLGDVPVFLPPDNGTELQHLPRVDARRIFHRVLRPANGLSAIVHGGSIAVKATECRQRRHLTVVPAEALT